MAINILLSTMGYLFVAHFCAGEMKSASMIVNATSSCCAADEIENIATEDNTGCCKDEYYVIWPAVNSLIYITTAPVDLELHNTGITQWKNP